MYYVIDYNSWWSYKKPLDDFHSAYMLQQLVNPHAQIEYWNGEEREIVWDPKWENFRGNILQ